MNFFNRMLTGLGRFLAGKPTAAAPQEPAVPASPPPKRPRRMNRSQRARMLVELGEGGWKIPVRRTDPSRIVTGYRIKGGWRVVHVY